MEYADFIRSNTIATLGYEAQALGDERKEYMQAKTSKAMQENAVLEAIVEAVRPALPAISSKVEGHQDPSPTHALARGIDLGGIYLGEQGDFFELAGRTPMGRAFTILSAQEVLDKTSLSAILAVLTAAIRAQSGKLAPRTLEIKREANILMGIQAAFRAGGVR